MAGVGLPRSHVECFECSIGKRPRFDSAGFASGIGAEKTMTALRIGGGASELPLSAMETIQVALMCRGKAGDESTRHGANSGPCTARALYLHGEEGEVKWTIRR